MLLSSRVFSDQTARVQKEMSLADGGGGGGGWW